MKQSTPRVNRWIPEERGREKRKEGREEGRAGRKEGVKKENENERKSKGNGEWQRFVLTLAGGNKGSDSCKEPILELHIGHSMCPLGSRHQQIQWKLKISGDFHKMWWGEISNSPLPTDTSNLQLQRDHVPLKYIWKLKELFSLTKEKKTTLDGDMVRPQTPPLAQWHIVGRTYQSSTSPGRARDWCPTSTPGICLGEKSPWNVWLQKN